MSEATRARPVEYQSPRGLILGLCFVWGVGAGFAVNFFREAETVERPPSEHDAAELVDNERSVPSELERRRQDIPSVTEVAPTPAQNVGARQTIEDVTVAPPPAVLTTEGGLTGRTAAPLGAWRRNAPPTFPPDAGATPLAPPPIPDLNP